jgi:DNA polymerase/3'-5' exonuclease PolX
MSKNAEIAEQFHGIADLLDVLGERFKPEAYRRAARSIESLTEDVAAVAAREELRSIPGVGEAIEEKIREYLRDGHIAYYDRLQKDVPAGLLELLRIPGLGPKTARRFWVELGIEGPAELTTAIESHRLDGVKGFGPKKIEQIRAALAAASARPAAGRMPIDRAYPVARRLLDGLRGSGAVEQIEVAGSFRRCRETVGDLDILVTSRAPERVFDAFSALAEVAEVRLRGPTKETVVLSNGLQVDLRVVEPAAFGAALLYFTGSKDHNVHLRSLARDRGLKINEYGIFRGEERIGGATEEEMYAALGLAWVPPELREDRGEVDAAAKGPLPKLVEATDLVGDLHLHLAPDATAGDVDRLAQAAHRRGLGYIGVVVASVGPDGTAWVADVALRDHLTSSSARRVTVYPTVEVTAEGAPSEFHDLRPAYTILRPGKAAVDPPRPVTGQRAPALVAHVGSGDGAERWVAWAKSANAAFEVGPGAERLDSTGARAAREAGVALAVPTGVDLPDDDPTAAVALGFARRAGALPGSVRNTRPAGEITRSSSGARKA